MNLLASPRFAVCLLLASTPAVHAAEAPKKGGAASAAEVLKLTEPKPMVLPETVAVVEGEEIKKAELETAFANVLASQGVPAESIPAEQKAEGYRQILDSIIAEKLVTKRSAEIKVSDEDVTAALNRIKGNFGTEEEMKAQIEKSGRTMAQVREELRGSLRQQHWLDEQIKGKTEVTEADAEAFYKGNPEQFKQPEQVRASHILISVPEDAKPEQVTEKEKQAKAVAERVKKKGEDFNKVAKEVSEDPSAKENSGDLDFFAKDQMVPQFSEVAFAMKKDEISDPVRSEFGFHVIKVTDRKAPDTLTLEQAKPKLMAFLKRQKTQDEVGKILRGIREKADVKVNLP